MDFGKTLWNRIKGSDEVKYAVKCWNDKKEKSQKISDGWETLKTKSMTLKEIKQLKSKPITHAKIHGTIPPTLHELLPDLINLYITEITDADMPVLLSCKAQFRRLETIQLVAKKGKEEVYLVDIFSSANSLKNIGLYGFRVPLMRFNSLGVLESLHLEQVTFVPKDISQLFSKLTTLTKLHLRDVKLTTIPESAKGLSKLTLLDLAHNDLSTMKDVDVLKAFPLLEELNLSNCHLKELPPSAAKLPNLRVLDISCNDLEELPEWLNKLDKLEVLNLKGNKSLQILGLTDLKSDTGFPALQSILVDDQCTSLLNPPLEVCGQGLEAIKLYYNDIEKSGLTTIPMMTALVTGQENAGKTSLIRTLQKADNARVLTDEDSSDRATPVFEFQEVEIRGRNLHLIDLGGQPVYHVTHQVAYREKFVPILVANMEEYNEKRKQTNNEEAAKKVCFNWLGYLRLTFPQLGSPMLVLTHKDRFPSTHDFNDVKQIFLNSCKKLQQKNAFKDAKLFCDQNVYSIGAEDNEREVFHGIKNTLYDRLCENPKRVPKSWEIIEKYILNCKQPFKLVSELVEEVGSRSRSQLKVILNYLHRSGRLLYYGENPTLNAVVFRNSVEVVKVIRILYNHKQHEQWQTRLATFDHANGIIDDTEYNILVNEFHDTAMMSQRLLKYLIFTESNFGTGIGFDLAAHLLTTFRLISRLKDSHDDDYIIPYYGKGQVDIPYIQNDNEIQWKIELQFKSYAPPAYAYHQISTTFLNSFPNGLGSLGQNGVRLVSDTYELALIHDIEKELVTIYVNSAVEHVNDGWINAVKATNDIIDGVETMLRGLKFTCVSHCLHCLLCGQAEPKQFPNPSWCRLAKIPQVLEDGMKKAMCKEEPVPWILRTRSKQLEEERIKQLKEYVAGLRQRTRSQGVAISQPLSPVSSVKTIALPTEAEDEEDALSDISTDGGGYIDPDDGDAEKVDLSTLIVQPCRLPKIRQLFSDPNVYPMTSPRGRCLIINNNNFSDYPVHGKRTGCEKDTECLYQLFRQLDFNVLASNDLTVMEMRNRIAEETAVKDHDRLGMFALVIMSHGGNNGEIYGVDGAAIKLTEILDMLSARNFSSMADKPKMIIVQACAGDRQDNSAVQEDKPRPTSRTPSQTPSGAVGGAVQPSSPDEDSGVVLNGSDFITITASQPTYAAMRHIKHGSLMIRALAVTFSKHASHRHVQELFEIVQDRVTRISSKLTRQNAFGQIPQWNTTLSNRRRLYLFPKYSGN